MVLVHKADSIEVVIIRYSRAAQETVVMDMYVSDDHNLLHQRGLSPTGLKRLGRDQSKYNSSHIDIMNLPHH